MKIKEEGSEVEEKVGETGKGLYNIEDQAEDEEARHFLENAVRDGEDNGGGEEEARIPRIPGRPISPTKAEVEEHEITHFPPRAWCQHCVAGHGISNQHRRQLDTEHDTLGLPLA